MLDWGKRTYIMGILNLTPDSFSGDSIMQQKDPVQYAVDQARQFVQDGADILDLGAESSRPGSTPVSAEEERKRLLPVIKAIKQENIPALLSVDTYKAEIADLCLGMGVDWINDIWGFQKDSALAQVAASHGTPVVLMHNRSKAGAVEVNSRLGASYDAGEYDHFMEDLIKDLEAISQTAMDAGVAREKIILDPGIGFGKTVAQNLRIIHCLGQIKSLGFPVLVGPSRKSFIGRVLDLPVEERTEGTAAAVAIAIQHGADIVRVHDVKHIARTAKMADAIVRESC